MDIIYSAGLTRSKGEARRLVQQSAVRLDGERVASVDALAFAGCDPSTPERVLQVGKRHFLRLRRS